MANIIDMPKLSDTMTVGTLVKWLKQEGDTVKNGDMLAEVETDKATMELECFFDGTLLKIFTPAGTQVEIGAPLCAVGKPGEQVEAPGKPAAGGETPAKPAGKAEKPPRARGEAPPPGAPASQEKPSRAEKKTPEANPPDAAGAKTAGKARVAGEEPAVSKTQPSDSAPPPAGSSQPPRVDSPAHPRSEQPSPSEGAASAGAGDRPAAAAEAEPAEERLRISPLARKLAAEKGIDPSGIAGSGPSGRIVRADILAAEKSGTVAAKASAAGGAGAFPKRRDDGLIQEEAVLPLSNMRATIARRLLESKTQIPHFYIDIEIDAEPLLSLRSQLNAGLERQGLKLSVNDFLLKASAEALRRVPAVNCSWSESTAAPGGSLQGGLGPAPAGGAPGPSIRRHGSAHVSFAVSIEEGLITPVIRDAQKKTIFEISEEARSLATLARNKKLQPAQFTGGTFCVSNMGMKGVDHFYAIINPPNAAILAVGAIMRKPVVKADRLVAGQRIALALSCDHRVVNGADGADFLAALRDLLESPALLLL